MGRAGLLVCLVVIPALLGTATCALGTNLVAWEDGRSFAQYGFDVYGYDLNTGLEIPICVNIPRDQADPAVSGDIVVWCDWRNDNGSTSNADIYGFRLPAGDTIVQIARRGSPSSQFAICTAPGFQMFPAISGSIVVWQDSRNMENSGWDIYGHNLATGEEFPVCSAPGNQTDPAISGSVVVWTDERAADATGSDIRGLNMETGEELSICVKAGSQSKPAIDGDFIVWEDWRNFDKTGPDVYGCDLGECRQFAVCTALGSQRSPSVSRGVVVWEDWRNDPGDNSNCDIYSYDTSSGMERAVCTAEGYQYCPVTSGNVVMWEDWRSDRVSGYDIQGYDLNLDREIDVCSAIGAQGCVTIDVFTGQLHAHWMSDEIWGVPLGSDYTPGGLEYTYGEHGYDFIAPTEHHPDPKWDGRAPGMFEDPGLNIIHLGDSMEDSAARTGASGRKYGSHILGIAFDADTINWDWVGYSDFWDTAEWRSNRLHNIRAYGGGLAYIAHPDSLSYRWSTRLLTKLYGEYDGIEVFNSAMDMLGTAAPFLWRQSRAFDTWTNLLQRGLDVRAVAGDDFAPNILAALDRACVTAEVYVPFGATRDDTQDAIEAALREGRFSVSYAPYHERGGSAWSGAADAPRILTWWYDGSASRARVSMYCPNGLSEVRFFTGSNPDRGIPVSWAPVGDYANTWEASLTCTDADSWVRVKLVDRYGRRSITQPIWLNRAESRTVQYPASTSSQAASDARPLVLDLADAHLRISYPQPGLSQVTAELVAVEDRPAAAPPLGYIGYCYSFSSAVAIQGVNTLTVAYDPDDVDLCGEDALWIYRYDGDTMQWIALPSAVDLVGRTVTAYVDRPGLYALSGEFGLDVTPPTVAIVSPGTGEFISGEIEIEAAATDDNGVASAEFAIDDLYLGYDTARADGWTCPLNASLCTNGTHMIRVFATDASGNESEASIEVNVSGGIATPEISITWPAEDTILWGEVEAAGDWLGDLGFGSGIVYLGEWAVALAAPDTPTGATWAVESEVPLPWYGPIVMTIEGMDTAGNRAASASLRVDFRCFSDVPLDFWARNHIYAAARAGVVQGYPEGTYQPSTEVTRDQMAVYISRALAGGDENVPDFTGAPTFPDVGAEQWALDYVEYAVEQSVVAGYDDGSYHPEYEVTRDQMAVYIARAMVSPSGEAALADYVPANPRDFADVPNTGYGEDGTEPFWAYRHVEYCAEQGVVQGYDDGLYHPEWVVTRDQMAVYIARAFELPM